MLEALRSLTPKQRSAVLASYLGWTLDAFDFFILVFVLKDVAKTFHSTVEILSWSLFLTLAARPIGALIFGLAADRFGRRPTLMVDIILFSVLEFASGLAPDIVTFFVLRALFGIAMGGEWGAFRFNDGLYSVCHRTTHGIPQDRRAKVKDLFVKPSADLKIEFTSLLRPMT